MKELKIHQETDNVLTNLALDTLQINKQALIFLNTRRSTEKTAEEIAKKIKGVHGLHEISEKARTSLSKPTKQCERLSDCLKKGIAFHRSGLTSDQKNLVEEHFRNGAIKIICATTTLAAGLDLPAFRSIVKDLRRYGHRGLDFIPTLEVEQMFGRAGRPKFDTEGQAICLAGTETERDEIEKRYIFGETEPIQSKLASEPALRTYLLSLISSNFVNSMDQILSFFKETFYAKQFENEREIAQKIDRILSQLEEWEFIISTHEEFVDAPHVGKESFKATQIGKRVSELYIDPYSASLVIECLKRSETKKTIAFPFLHMVSQTLEMRPLFRVKTKELDKMNAEILKYYPYMLIDEPALYEPEYDDFLHSFKTSFMLLHWIDEKDEEFLFNEFDIRPGEFKQKLDIADWLLFCAEEIGKLMQFHIKVKEIIKARIRLQHGIREELLPLIKFNQIGRVRARRLFVNGIKDAGDVRNADITKLVQILGKETALHLKKQVGEDYSHIVVKEGKRKGQISLKDY